MTDDAAGHVCPAPMLDAELREALDMVEELACQGMYSRHPGQYEDHGLSVYEDAADLLQRHRPERWQVTAYGMVDLKGPGG